MKNVLENSDVREMHQEVQALKKELFGLKLNAQSESAINTSRFKVLRKEIARRLTRIRQLTMQKTN